MFFGHSLATTGCKSAISASSLALGSTLWSLRREQYGLVTASYSIEFEGSQKSGASATGGATVSGARRKDARPSALSFSALRSPGGIALPGPTALPNPGLTEVNPPSRPAANL